MPAGPPTLSDSPFQNWAVQAWLQKGAEAEKLVLGIAGYGQSFTLQDVGQHGVGAPTNGAGKAGRWRRMEGQLAYYEVKIRNTMKQHTHTHTHTHTCLLYTSDAADDC